MDSFYFVLLLFFKEVFQIKVNLNVNIFKSHKNKDRLCCIKEIGWINGVTKHFIANGKRNTFWRKESPEVTKMYPPTRIISTFWYFPFSLLIFLSEKENPLYNLPHRFFTSNWPISFLKHRHKLLKGLTNYKNTWTVTCCLLKIHEDRSEYEKVTSGQEIALSKTLHEPKWTQKHMGGKGWG